MLEKMWDVVIVGSGLSGVVAANHLAEHSLKVLLLDENIHTGGQLLRKIPEVLGLGSAVYSDQAKKIGFQFVQHLKKLKIDLKQNARVLGIYPGNDMLIEEDEKQVDSIKSRVLLLATGARERFLPFKGWTLPGVYSTGAVQVLIKSSGVLPGRDCLVGGSGLFLFAVAYELLRNKAKVLAVMEQTSMLNKALLLTQFVRQFGKFSEGARFLLRIFFSRVPVHHRTRIIEARGKGVLEEIVTARVDKKGGMIPGSERVFRTESAAVGYGFVPNIELAQLAGCQLEWDAGLDGWVVKVLDSLETTIKDIFAAGEITGIAGGLKSINEGKIAALSILFKLGKLGEHEYLHQLGKLNRERHTHLKFGRYFNSLYRIPKESIFSIPDETIVCRCEDVKMGDIKKAVTDGYRTPAALKVAIRTAMGDCQGRTCAPVVYDILSALTQSPIQTLEPFTVRPPIKPVAVDSLIHSTE